MSKALTLFVPLVAMEVPMVPRPIHIAAIRQACMEFCKLSNAWKEWLDTLTISSTERAIEVEHPDKARIVKVLNARFNNVDMDFITPAEANEKYPGWDVDLSGDPKALFLRTRDELRLCPHPSVDGGALDIEAVLMPSQDAISVADFLYLDHSQAIADGTKAYLMEQANQPWTNPQRAAQLRGKFESAANSLNVGQTVGFTRARLRTRLENR